MSSDERVYQKEIIDASELRKIASRDVCLRLVKKLAGEGKIIRHHDGRRKNAIYFTAADGRLVREALQEEAKRRLSSLEPAAAESPAPEPQDAAAASDQTTHEPPAIQQPEAEADEPKTGSSAEPKSIKQLAAAPGPKKRTPDKKAAKKGDPDPEGSNLEKKKGFKIPKSAWMYVGVGALLLLGFGWWRARKKRMAMTDTGYDYASEPEQTTTEEPQRPQMRTDAEQLAQWNSIFEGL